MQLTALGKGVFVPIPTFFDSNENLDIPSLEKHIKMLARTGISGIIFLGSMGEAAHLTLEEREQVIRAGCQFVKKENPSFKIIAGASAPSARQTIQLCKNAADAGAEFALVLPPSYYRTCMDNQAVMTYFSAVADSSPIPLIIYNYPGVCQGLDISVDVLVELSKHKNIIGVKATDGNIGKIGYLAEHTNPSEFALLAGSADFFLPALAVGAVGLIPGLGNILPRCCVAIQRLFENGEMEKARSLQTKLVKADNAAARWYGLAGVKAALQHIEGYGGVPRNPLRPLTDAEKGRVVEVIDSVMDIERSLVE
ncbi:hypothetical protein EC973_005470 [Apophysomyces ossiformis]|uniref:Uncharacterized protein n=1 Tax=Apophysomyces ossiformis TaxID=679940 RepID=A0A8H7ER00_9FUNG|nr:hypothetical protein EC973_005470 [Apophysomyces ossiformis]